MKNKFDKIDETLDIEPISTNLEVIETEAIESTQITNSIKNNKKGEGEDEEKDYEYTRGNLYSLIEKGQQAISDILDVAQQSDSPRAYEVAGQLIKNVGDVADKLIDLQQKMKKLKEEDLTGPRSVTNNNTLFVGSTAELQKLLKQNMQSTEDSK